jgi:hypothetical protein
VSEIVHGFYFGLGLIGAGLAAWAAGYPVVCAWDEIEQELHYRRYFRENPQYTRESRPVWWLRGL